MKISLIQYEQNALNDLKSGLVFEKERRRELSREILGQNLYLIKQAAEEGSDLILTSEAVNYTGAPVDPDTFDLVEPFGGDSFICMAELAKQYRTNILAGLYNKRDNRCYHSAVWFGPRGNTEAVYDKIHLRAEEKKKMVPGSQYVVHKASFGNIGILIGSDMVYPEAARVLTLMGADMIACPTWEWSTVYGPARAYENGIAIAAAMAVPYGHAAAAPSMIVDGTGELIAKSRRASADVVTADLKLPRAECCAERLNGRRFDTYQILSKDFGVSFSC